ncbi:MAG TPA: sialidase family protein [Candidatus Acidoferrum sp.]|nr:sialidase family protein [Candidatus Acidoferrum sp.]
MTTQTQYFTFAVVVLFSQALMTGQPSLSAQQPSAEAALSPPPGAAVVEIVRKEGYANEPAIAVNSKDPQQLVGAYQSQASAAFSRDGGKTWTIAKGTAATDYRVSGDVSVTFDNQGRAFLCFIAFDKLGTENYWARGATRNGIFVRRSTDGGQTWEQNAATVIAQKTEPGIPFEDKPYIIADNTHSRFAGDLYVGWTEFTLTKSVILFSRSTDGGATWSKPIEISTHEGLPRDDTGAVEGFTGAVGEDGTVYAAWADGSEIALAVSHDGGQTFSRSSAIVKTAPSYFALAGTYRANGFPEIGIDPQSGRLFVSWADYRNGDIDVFVSTSSDHGKRWSEATRVNTDALHDGADQFFQWLAVDPVDGSANLVFYDRRADPENRMCSFTLARSTDGGRTFANYAWTSKPWDPQGGFIGDYSGIAAYGGRVYGIWGRNARPDEIAEMEKEQGQDKPPSVGNAEGQRRARARFQVVEVGIADFSQTGARR